MSPTHPIRLASWRRAVAEMYADVRRVEPAGLPTAAQRFRQQRDDLFRQHADTPLSAAQRRAFTGLAYAPYDPRWRLKALVRRLADQPELSSELPADGLLRLRAVAELSFTPPAAAASSLTLFWIEGYGGGLFLPFRDTTNGDTTYGGGRYLLDSIKGADLGQPDPESLWLDFNFAYHPSCAYNDQWVCPLAPPTNHLSIPVPVGEFTTLSLHTQPAKDG